MDIITIPVSGLMSKQPDGSYKMVQAEYMEVSADTVAKFLIKQFGTKAIRTVENET